MFFYNCYFIVWGSMHSHQIPNSMHPCIHPAIRFLHRLSNSVFGMLEPIPAAISEWKIDIKLKICLEFDFDQKSSSWIQFPAVAAIFLLSNWLLGASVYWHTSLFLNNNVIVMWQPQSQCSLCIPLTGKFFKKTDFCKKCASTWQF